jgi:CHAT domain-containing protein/tetratricopeptide (TPR) repeat protein
MGLLILGADLAEAGDFDDAVDALQEAVHLIDRETHPFDWALATSKLGYVLKDRDRLPTDLEDARTLFEQAREIVRRDRTFDLWMSITFEIALIHDRWNERSGNEEDLETAIAIYRDLEASATAPHLQLQRLGVLHRLGLALGRRSGADPLSCTRESRRTLQQAFIELAEGGTTDDISAREVDEWAAQLLDGVARTYLREAAVTEQPTPAREAVAIARKLVDLAGRDPRRRAESQQLLGCALLVLAAAEPARFAEAAAHLEAATAAAAAAEVSQGWMAVTSFNLGSAILGAADTTDGDAHQRAVDALEHAASLGRGVHEVERSSEWKQVFVLLGEAYLAQVSHDALPDHLLRVAASAAALEEAFRQCDPTTDRKLAGYLAHQVAFLRHEHPRAFDEVDGATATLWGTRAVDLRAGCEPRSEWAESAHMLGVIHYDAPSGDRAQRIDAAIELFESVVEQLDGAAGAEDLLGRTLNDLGNALDDRLTGDIADNVERAIETYRRALTIRTATAMPRQWAETTMNLADCYRERLVGDDAANVGTALELLGHAERVLQRDLHPDQWGQVQHNLGITHLGEASTSKSESLDRGIDCLTSALEVRTRDGDRRGWALTTLALCQAHNLRRSDGDLEAAVALGEDIVTWSTADRLVGMAHHQIAVAIISLDRDRWRAATTHLRAAVGIFAALGDRRARLAALERLGRILASASQWHDAAEAFAEGVEVAEGLFDAASFLDGREAMAEHAREIHAAAAIAFGRTGEAQRAWKTIEAGRSRQITRMLRLVRADLTTLEREEPALATEYLHAVGRLRRAEGGERALRLDRSAGGADEHRSPRAFQREASDAGRRVERAIDAIRRRPGFERFLDDEAAAGPSEAVLGSGVIAYLVTSSWGTMTLLVHGWDPTEVDVAFTERFTDVDLSGLLVRPGTDGEPTDLLALQLEGPAPLGETFDDETIDLSREVVAPLAAHAARLGAHRLTLVPCGRLGLLPLHLVRTAPNGPRLLDELDTRYLPSLRFANPRSGGPRRDGPSVLVVAHASAPNVPDLRFVDFEAEQCGNAYASATPLLGADATVAGVLDRMSEVSVLHLACHGQYSLEEPLASGVHLSDGPLTLASLLSWEARHDVDLVVLSACQTGIHDVLHLPDEVLGLPAGLLASGVSGVVASMWPVDDLATAVLMVRFHEELSARLAASSDAPPSDALRKAQRWLARASAPEVRDHLRRLPDSRADSIHAALDVLPTHHTPFGDPYFWGGFVYIGV